MVGFEDDEADLGEQTAPFDVSAQRPHHRVEARNHSDSTVPSPEEGRAQDELADEVVLSREPSGLDQNGLEASSYP